MKRGVITLSSPKCPEWYSPYCLDLEHTIQVCRGDRVDIRYIVKLFVDSNFKNTFAFCMYILFT